MLIRYTAVDGNGKTKTGDLDVNDQREALVRLSAMGLTPIALDEGIAQVPWWQRDVSLSSSKVDEKALQSFLFDLSYMLRANLALLPSVEMIVVRMKNVRLKSILSDAVLHLKNGQSLTEALTRAEPDLNQQVLMALKIGEKSNTLAAAAEQSANALGANIKLKASIVSAAIYPVILLIMSAAVLWIVLFYLLPVLVPLFIGTDPADGAGPLGPLLLVRRIVVVAGQGLVVVLIALLFAVPVLKQRGLLPKILDTLPVVGVMRRYGRSQIVAGTIANIMMSGGDIDTALDVVVRTSSVGLVRDQMSDVRQRVQDGASLSHALTSATAFDPTLQQMAALGEQGEQMPELMRVASGMIEDEMRKKLEKMVAMLVPVLTVTIGITVGGLVMMTMGAVMSINDLAQ